MNRCLAILRNALLMLALSVSAQAKPEYARAENRACGFCHVSGSPNTYDPLTKERQPTTRNKRGMYYETHNHSFVGYKVTRVTQERLNSKFIWGEETDDMPRRIASGDVMGDGKPRFISLHETPDDKGSVLKVRRWDGKTFVTELEEKSESSPDKLQVGKFAGEGSPAIIVTEKTLWAWNGKSFSRKTLSNPRTVIGATILKNKEERLLIADAPADIRSYRINPKAPGDWLVDSIPAPKASKDVVWLAMHGSLPTLVATGLGEEYADGGVLGFWTPFQDDKLYLYYVKVDRDADIDKATKKVTIKGEHFYVVMLNMRGFEVWASARLDMRPLDVIIDNIRGDGKQGMMVLLKEPVKGKPRQIGFYELTPSDKEQ